MESRQGWKREASAGPARDVGPFEKVRVQAGWHGPELLYAFGAFGANVFHQTVTLWLVYFYAPPPESGRPTLIPLVVLGALLGLGRVIEAFDDPVIGYWSDRTRSRFGRRIPFIVVGTPLLVLAFVLLWTPLGAMPWSAVYVFVATQIYFFLATVVHQPYEAVLAEITRDSTERVRVSSWKVTFGTIGAGVALVGSSWLIGPIGFAGMAIVFGGLAAASYLLASYGIHRLPRQGPQERPLPLREALRQTATNRQFLVFVCCEVLFFLGLNMLTLLVPYFVTVVLGEPENMVGIFTGLFAGAAVVSLPLVNYVAAKRGKKFTYQASMAIVAVMLAGLFYVGELPGVAPSVQGLVWLGLLGVPMAAQLSLPNPFVADLVDDDELRTGLRREGVYYGVEETIGKLGFALSTVVFGAVLQGFGFSAAQPLGIRLIGPVAGVGVLAGLLLFARGYTLPDHVVPRREVAPP